MLAPDTRTLLLDSLRPPIGYQLEHAVATSFTLDLNSALLVPLALAGFNLSGTPDVVAVMEALRSSVGKFDVFAQAGMIKTNSWPGDLTALLESSIHTVHRPRPGHLFHPKVWVLKFSQSGNTLYRCIVSSRNLTTDRSWDVVLRLDSDPDITKRNSDNDGLVRMVSSLGSMPGGRLKPERHDRLNSLAEELKRVTWQMPEGADSVRFVALGVPGGVRRRDLGSLFVGYRHLVISPFLTEGGLDVILNGSPKSEVMVVSRPDQLDQIEKARLDAYETFTVNLMAGLEENDVGETEGSALLGDLHAKVYVIESNRRSFVYVGSANATDAAFGGNVELLCEISGGATKMGIEQMMGDDARFRTILEPYISPSEVEIDHKAEAIHQLDSYLVDLAQCELTFEVKPAGPLYAGTLTSDIALPKSPSGGDISLTLSPMNQSSEQRPIEPGSLLHLEFSPREVGDLTAFFTVKASSVMGGLHLERSTVLRASMVNDPQDRFDSIVVRQLDSPEKFLRFLMLLLALGGHSTPAGFDATLGGEGVFSRSTEGLFELLVRAMVVQPESLDRLSTIIENLQKHGKAENVLPEGWDEVWSAIRQAQEIVSRRSQ